MVQSKSSPGPFEPGLERNSVVLEVSHDRFPKTLKDIDLDDSERTDQNRLAKLKNSIHKCIPIGLDIGDFSSHIGAKVQFHQDLAEPSPSSNHVYVICSPHWAWPTSHKHWSLYTQGHFYHLTIDDPASCLAESAASTSLKTSQQSKTILNHQDLSSENTSDFIQYNDKRGKLALIAYQVGKTHYTHDEVYKLASWLIKCMPIYSRLADNCQRFVYSLLHRTVMTKRDFATFVGNGLQLVKWDKARSSSTNHSSNDHQSCIENGFEISNGVTEVPPLFSYIPVAGLVNDLFGATRASIAVRKLYRQGPRAVGSYNPNGHESQISHVLHKSAADFVEVHRDFKRVIHEFYEDVRDQNWEDAFRGRRETTKEFYDQVLERKRQGDQFTAFEIWWFERILRIAPKHSVVQDASHDTNYDEVV